MSNPVSVERREVRTSLQDTVDLHDDAANIPLALARAVQLTEMSPEQKRDALSTIRAWTNYATGEGLSADEPYAIRYHIGKFATQEFGDARTPERLIEVDIDTLTQNGVSFADILAEHTSPDILHDPDVAIVGGAARTALKMHVGRNIWAELPISDIDAIISANAPDVAATAEKYGIALSGAKVVDGSIRDAIDGFATNVDCTMNQAVIHGGKLLCTEAAINDIRSGAIRLIAKNDPLFGSEGIVLPDGNVYLNRTGFYRGLSFLLRKKGGHLVVSEENIEKEKTAIGRYWQIMLFVKLLPMENEMHLYNAIGNWHEIAQRIGSTESADPQAFLEELMEAYPTTGAGKKGESSPEAQARWIMKRLIGEGVEQLYGKDTPDLPETYTEANLSLALDFDEYDYDGFMQYVRSLGR